jgi:amyloid beta precursor protein binding protein 1
MADQDVTPPPLHGPSAKEKKYDRQLRLWAASGQAALEAAHLLLVNAGPGVIGVESLKNLVLPGIGHFTILDPAIVQAEDLGVNFFLDETSLGKSRAEQTCNFLKELNPDVEGHFLSEPLESFITRRDSLRSYSHILVASPVDPQVLFTISEHAQRTHTPVFYLHCVGFYAHFSLYLPPTFPIVDTHPDPNSTTDLRLVKPWPALSEFAAQKTKDLESMSDHEHGHVSYILLLLHYLEKWKKSHGGEVPSTYKEKNEFRELVGAGMRPNNAEGSEENYEEAVAAVLKSLNEPSPSSAVKDMLNALECKDLFRQSANFWIIANAISQFYKKHGVLPLPGSVPDMKAQSEDYIQLQNVYKSKARQDVEEVIRTVRSLEAQLGRSSHVESSEVEAFCKNAGHVKLVRGRPFHIIRPDAKLIWGDRAKFAANALTDDSSLMLLYIAFLAYDEFCATHSANLHLSIPQPPGVQDIVVDEEKLTGIAYRIISNLLKEAGSTLKDSEYDDVKEKVGEICAELVRAGGAELHNIAALTGGLVAQEVIKVITKQYIPVDNTCLFDGIRSVSAVLRL